METIDWVRRCMIVPAALQAQCQTIPEASGMWTTGLSLDATAPATHYISSGLVDQAFADLLASPEAIVAAAGVTLEEAQAIVAGMHVSEDEPHVAMDRLLLKLVIPPESL